MARSRRFSLPSPLPLRRDAPLLSPPDLRSESLRRPPSSRPRLELSRGPSSRRFPLPLSLFRLLLSELRLESLLGVLGALGAGALGGGELGGGLDGSGLSGFKSCVLAQTLETQVNEIKAKDKSAIAATGDLIFMTPPLLNEDGITGKSVSALYADLMVVLEVPLVP